MIFEPVDPKEPEEVEEPLEEPAAPVEQTEKITNQAPLEPVEEEVMAPLETLNLVLHVRLSQKSADNHKTPRPNSKLLDCSRSSRRLNPNPEHASLLHPRATATVRLTWKR